jgi:hypothetical protein
MKMTIFLRAALLLSSVILAVNPSHARDFGEHGGYDVAAIETSGETQEKGDRGYCAMREEFKGPGSTRLTLLRKIADPDLIYVIVDNWHWSIEEDAEYKGVTYEFSSGSYYEREATGVVDSIYKGLLTAFPYSEFMSEFRKAKYIDIHRQGTVVDELSLEGSAVATTGFERCWSYLQTQDGQKMREWKRFEHIPEDPFAKPAQP